MHTIWNEMGMFNVTKQRLVAQENNILRRKWLQDLELEEIQRIIKDIGNSKVGWKALKMGDVSWYLIMKDKMYL